MTETELRDWFAGRAMSAMLRARNPSIIEPNGYAAERISREAYVIADLMLKERSKEQGNENESN